MKKICIVIGTRPETLEIQSNILAGTSPDKILECTKKILSKMENQQNTYWT